MIPTAVQRFRSGRLLKGDVVFEPEAAPPAFRKRFPMIGIAPPKSVNAPPVLKNTSPPFQNATNDNSVGRTIASCRTPAFPIACRGFKERFDTPACQPVILPNRTNAISGRTRSLIRPIFKAYPGLLLTCPFTCPPMRLGVEFRNAASPFCRVLLFAASAVVIREQLAAANDPGW
jgi:hypothetical protein